MSHEMTELTAEQVREIVEEHTHDFGNDWQAIADELNEALGRGTCRNVHRHHAYGFECSVCKWDAYEPNDYGNDVRFDDFNYCPNCGRRVSE